MFPKTYQREIQPSVHLLCVKENMSVQLIEKKHLIPIPKKETKNNQLKMCCV